MVFRKADLIRLHHVIVALYHAVVSDNNVNFQYKTLAMLSV